jgi:hypothetical protein
MQNAYNKPNSIDISPPFLQFLKGVYNEDIKSASRASKMWVNLFAVL